MKRISIFVGCIVALCLLTNSALAEDKIYRWEDSSGVAHYTSKAPSKDAKPASLPKIQRNEYRMSLGRNFDLTCDRHGGVNCQAGADKDGSVVCFDGFTGASSRFKLTCSSPKLEILDITTEERLLKVSIRNTTSIKAKKPVIWLRLNSRDIRPLEGPEEIEAFGIGDFSLKLDDQRFMEKPTSGMFTLNCANCS